MRRDTIRVIQVMLEKIEYIYLDYIVIPWIWGGTMNLVNVEFKIRDLNYMRAHDFENYGLS